MCIQVITFFLEPKITDKFNKISPVSLSEHLTFGSGYYWDAFLTFQAKTDIFHFKKI